MFHLLRLAAVSGCAMVAVASPAPISAATVTPHVFNDGLTLVDLAREDLDPWGFYDGTKGMPVSGSEAAKPVAAGDPMPGGWVAASGWGSSGSEGSDPVPLFAPAPIPFGFAAPQAMSPCFWRNGGFGSVESRDRCGHPAIVAQEGSPRGGVALLPTPVAHGWSGAGERNGVPVRPVPVTMPVPGPTPKPVPSPMPVPLPATGWLLAAALIALVRRKQT